MPEQGFWRPRLGWPIASALLAVVALVLLPIGVGATPEDNAVRRVALQLQCPVCEGQSIADSSSGLAHDMRAVIRSKQAAGEGDQQVLGEFVAAYGDGILTEPPKHGVGLGVWFGSLLGVGLGTIGLAGLARRWRNGAVTPSPVSSVVNPVVVGELERFRQELGQ